MTKQEASEGLFIVPAADAAQLPSRPERLPGPRSWPMVGNLSSFLSTPPHLVISRWAKTYGPIFRYRLGDDLVVCIADPEMVKTILKARPGSFRRSKRLTAAIESTGFKGVFTAEQGGWEKQRRLVMKGLTPTIVHESLPHINLVAQRLVSRWRAAGGSSDNVATDLQRFSSDVVVKTALGVDLNSVENPDSSLQKAISTWFASIGRKVRIPASVYPLVRKLRPNGEVQAVAFVRETAVGAIAQARQRMGDASLSPENILEAFVRARDEEGSDFTEADVLGNAATMILAGQETTASAMQWILYYLGRDKTLFAKVRELADQFRREAGDEITPDALSRATALQRLCLKVLQLRPTAPLFGLDANQPVKIGDLHLPKDQRIVLLLRPFDMEPDEEKARLTVADWVDEEGPGVNASSESLAFGAGARLCPGRYLALTELMTLTLIIAREFDVGVVDGGAAVAEKYSFAMHPNHLALRFTVRELVTSG